MQAYAKFFLMGGYATYVWTAYGAVALVLIANGWWSRHTSKRVSKQLISKLTRQ